MKLASQARWVFADRWVVGSRRGVAMWVGSNLAGMHGVHVHGRGTLLADSYKLALRALG